MNVHQKTIMEGIAEAEAEKKSSAKKGSSTHKIGWLNLPGYKGETWNPIIGCSKVSAGCKNCYALKMAIRIAGMERKKDVINYRAALMPDKNNKQTEWSGLTFLREESLTKPASWKKPRLVFVCSMGDLFHESTSFEEINAVFSVMADNDQHIFIVLTKRPERMITFYEWKQAEHGVAWQPSNNIWLGVTAENQEQANKRIPKLLSVRAAVRFVSVEPMLSKVNLNKEYFVDEQGTYLFKGVPSDGRTKWLDLLDWVIAGGETGHNARPMHPDWVRLVRDQCKNAGVPFFFKQWGEWLPWEHDAQPPFMTSQNEKCVDSHQLNIMDPETGDVSKGWNDGMEMLQYGLTPCAFQKVGRKQAGNLIDGQRFEEYPEVEL